ncbi:response regulator transcription factor [Paracrocinitomix mangrovi]|uniref:response regulator transcription factor n=1 Tax=Paracrocinitomix mangrovi TaxID=2862509 RepID=UPI001C8E46A0|nr:response regulator transcription factor [Paracrocinitomix mangrovi]UKN01085.1 response regulator transcription factor [Paracrocinitomix mangrovi]
MSNKINIAVVDDHQLFRGGLIELIHSTSSDFEVMLEAKNGKNLFELLDSNNLPDIVLLDINMPVMDGYKTAEKLIAEHPEIKILIITMNDDDESLIKMLRIGINGYISKDVEQSELKEAIENMVHKGFHYNEKITAQLVRSIRFPNETDQAFKLTERELDFLNLACSEDTYEQIADKMCLSVKTIDGYRASIFEKLDVKSRVGMVIYAIKNGLVDLN